MANQQVFTPVEAGAQFIGWAAKTSRNKLTQGKYPFPVRCIGGRKIVLLVDVEAVLLSAPIVAGPEPLPPAQPQSERVVRLADASPFEPAKPPRPLKRKPGRPRKAEMHHEES